MPVSPKDVEHYVRGSDTVDRAMRAIDDLLCSSAEKRYRHGEEFDYFYRLVYDGTLSTHDKNQLEKAYRDAGWGAVQVRNSEEVGERPGYFIIRIIRQADSRYLQWNNAPELPNDGADRYRYAD